VIRTPAGLVATVLEVLTAVAMAVAVGAAAVRAVRLRRQQRRAAALEIARPLLMAAIADDTERDLAPHALQPHVGRCLDSLAVSLAVKLRGADRAALVDILHRRGTVRRARERTRSLTPVRRLRAVELLGALGIAECRPDLEARLRDRNADVRRAAVRALGRVGGPESAGALIALLDATTRRLPEHGVTLALTRCGPSAVPALTSALQDGGPRARRAAAQVLGWLGATTAVDTLCAALDDPCDDVQVEVITALGRIGVPSAASPIRARLEPTYPGQVRTAAASALGRLDDATSVPALAAALLDDHQVARSAAAALAQLGQTGRQALTAAAALAIEAREVLAVPAMAGLTLAGDHGVPEESQS
jgi:HEAT repeat protein